MGIGAADKHSHTRMHISSLLDRLERGETRTRKGPEAEDGPTHTREAITITVLSHISHLAGLLTATDAYLLILM